MVAKPKNLDRVPRIKQNERQGTVSVKTEVKVRRKKGAVKQAQLMG